MTAAACVMPDRRERLPTMARFHRRSCFPNAANCGQGKGGNKKNGEKEREREEEMGAAVNIMENMSTWKTCQHAVC